MLRLRTLILLTLGVAAVPAIAQEPELHPVEANLIRKTNAERVKHGLPPLEIAPKLVASARKHAIWMCRTGQFQHSTDRVAENIAHGQRSSTEAIRSWMNSPGHRANLLNPRYRRLGVAAYCNGPGQSIYWVQQFLP